MLETKALTSRIPPTQKKRTLKQAVFLSLDIENQVLGGILTVAKCALNS